MGWTDCPVPGAAGLHKFGGIAWRYDEAGVFIDDATQPGRTPGELGTVTLAR